MRGLNEQIADVNDAIVEVKRAKDELKAMTVELVSAMISEGRTKSWGNDYIALISESVDDRTAHWAKHYFDEEWARQTTTPE